MVQSAGVVGSHRRWFRVEQTSLPLLSYLTRRLFCYDEQEACLMKMSNDDDAGNDVDATHSRSGNWGRAGQGKPLAILFKQATSQTSLAPLSVDLLEQEAGGERVIIFS